MADSTGGIQPVQVSSRSDYGGGKVGLLKKMRGKSGGGGDTDDPGSPSSMARGGKVRKTGMIRMHKGEYVIPASKAKRMKMRGGKRR